MSHTHPESRKRTRRRRETWLSTRTPDSDTTLAKDVDSSTRTPESVGEARQEGEKTRRRERTGPGRG